MTDEQESAGAVVERLIRIKDSLSSQDQRDTISDACNIITTAQGKVDGLRDAYTGAMEDKRMWRKRAQEAEAELERLKNPPEEYCAKCGSPKSNHPYRHRFTPRDTAMSDNPLRRQIDRRAVEVNADLTAALDEVERLREALTASRETHCGIAEHVLQGGKDTKGIFADSQRARLAIDATLLTSEGADQ